MRCADGEHRRGEPLLHPEIAAVAKALVERRRYVYLCTNALLLERKLDEFAPSKFLSFSVHMDGPRAEHDHSVSARASTTWR